MMRLIFIALKDQSLGRVAFLIYYILVPCIHFLVISDSNSQISFVVVAFFLRIGRTVFELRDCKL